ncbi:MAG: sigma-70 family RNA polymerase sigma factor [Bacteroidia bacterium]|nr:sigma-70 family RNA polymerase sigma factor [Bacteroidia bacterium]
MSDERQLVRDCLRKRPEAQHQLYNRYAESMLGVCYRYTKSIADAEDVLQEGFIKVFKNLHQYKYEGEFGAWIRRIMVTTSLNFLKKNYRYRTELTFENENLHPVADDNPELKISGKELAELIRQLPIGYQTVFNLHAAEGYSHVEIGKMLGIHEGTSRSQYARARNLLCCWLGKKNETNFKTESYAGK